MCRSKLAEVVIENIIKVELLRLGWFLENTRLEETGRRTGGSDLMSTVRVLCNEFSEVYFSIGASGMGEVFR